MGFLLVLQPLEIGKFISEMEFLVYLFWVQAHGFPVKKMSSRNSQIIANKIGKLIGVEVPTKGMLLFRSFLRLRVEIDVTQPLPRGFFMSWKGAQPSILAGTWVDFKYEHLLDFCYDCGRIGYDRDACKFISHKVGCYSAYGRELRTS